MYEISAQKYQVTKKKLSSLCWNYINILWLERYGIAFLKKMVYSKR